MRDGIAIEEGAKLDAAEVELEGVNKGGGGGRREREREREKREEEEEEEALVGGMDLIRWRSKGKSCRSM